MNEIRGEERREEEGGGGRRGRGGRGEGGKERRAGDPGKKDRKNRVLYKLYTYLYSKRQGMVNNSIR